MITSMQIVADTTGITHFDHQNLLQLALTDPDCIVENFELTPQEKQNQILEHQGLIVLGSVVFDMIVTDYLAEEFSAWNQSTRTVLKSDLVNPQTLSRFSQELHLKESAQFNHPLHWKHPREQDRILAQMFEAFMGVLYLEFDQDLTLAEHWLVQRLLQKAVANLLSEALADDEDFSIFSENKFNWQNLFNHG